MTEMRKLIRGDQVAILYSPGYGAGWFTWNRDFPECIFDPEIVELVLQQRPSSEIEALAETKWGIDFYSGGADQLKVRWLDVGSPFRINEYDGSESIVTSVDFMTA